MKTVSFVLIVVLLATLALSCMPGDITESWFFQNLFPNSDNTGSIGSSSLGWMEAYIHSIYADRLLLGGVVFSAANITGGPEVDPVFLVSPASVITLADINTWDDHPALTTGTHGVTGTIVGTSDPQSLTGKEITMDNNEPIYWEDTLGAAIEVFNVWLDNNLSILEGEHKNINIWLSSGTGQTMILWPTGSTAGSVLRDSPTIDFNANYWDTTNKNWEAKVIHDMRTAGATPKSWLRFSIQGEDVLRLENDTGVVKTYSDGALQTGDATNYSLFTSDGTLTMTGTAKVVNELWIDAGGIKAPGAKPAIEIAHGALETPAWQFADQALEANQQSISYNMRIPERMDRTVAPTVSIGWSTTTTDSGDNSTQVKWQLEYLWTSLDESTVAAAQGTLTVITSASTVAEGMVSSTFTGIDIPSTTDICMHCKITRLSADASDTVVDDVELHGVCLSWTSNKLGGDVP